MDAINRLLFILFSILFTPIEHGDTLVETGIQEMVIEAVINFQSARYMCCDIIKTRIDS